jgi:iron complex outermembrane receptor protein
LGTTVLVLMMSIVSAGADTLSGRVQDSQGLAVAHANVRLLDRVGGGQRNTVSGADGAYTFAELPPGTYVIEADAADSALIGSQVVIISGQATLNLTLRVAAAKTEVSVTASTTPQSITEISKALDVVDSAQMNLRGVFQISEAIRIMPGVQVQTFEGPGSLTTIQTRGLRVADTAVLIDGLRFQDSGSLQNDATAFLGDLVITDTERVEFLRGSSSSLYGSSAMAGVMNIVSRSGGGPTHGDLRVEGGGLGLFRGVGGIGGGLDSNRVSYSGSVSYLDITSGVRGRSPYRNFSGQGSVRYAPRPQIMISGRLWGDNADLTSTESPAFTPAILANSSPGRVEAIPLPTDQLELFEQELPFDAGNATYIPNQIDPDGERASSFVSGIGAFQQVLSDGASYRVAYQGVDTRRGYRDGPAGPYAFDPASPETNHFNGRTDTLQGRYDRRLGTRHFITAGYEFMREKYFSFDDTPIDDTRNNAITLSQLSHALYGQDQIQLASGRLQVTLSGRLQFFSLDQPTFSGAPGNPYEGNLSAIETPAAATGDLAVAHFLQGSQTKLRAHVGNSYRAPSSYERFGGGFGSYYGDPRLEPERAVAFDAGVDQWLSESKLQVSGTFFWTSLNEAIRFLNTLPPNDPFGRFFGYANGGGGDARGLELSVNLSPSQRTQAQASYTYADSESETATFGADYFKLLGFAPHTFALSVTQWMSPRFHATFDLFTKSSYATTMFGATGRLFEFDGTTKANLVLGYEFPISGRRALEIYTRVENVFDKVPYEEGFIGPGAWAVAGVRLRY